MRFNPRPAVFFIALSTGIWSILCAISCFGLVTDYNVDVIPGLKIGALILGILYTIGTTIQLFGLFAASSRKPNLVKIYAYGYILTALSILAGGVAQIIVHFAEKDVLMDACINDATRNITFYGWGIWRPTSSTTLSLAHAAAWCKYAWDVDLRRVIVTYSIQLCILAFFLFLIFYYYKRLRDPSQLSTAR